MDIASMLLVVQRESQHCSQVLCLRCVMVDGGAAAGLAVPSVTSQVQLMHLQIVGAAWKHPK